MKIIDAVLLLSAFVISAQASSSDRQVYQHGTITKIRSEVLSEAKGGPQAPSADAARASQSAETAERHYLYVRSGSTTYVAQAIGKGERCTADDFAGGPVDFRLAGKKMFLKCPRGDGELETIFAIQPGIGRKVPVPENAEHKRQ